MAEPKKNAYGIAADPAQSFRKTWDKEEYAKKAEERRAAAKEEAKARSEAAAAGKKYHKRAATPEDVQDTSARAGRIDVASFVGKTQIVPAGAGVGKRGKSAGFYCENCDLTFKDNLQYVEHLNSKQHLQNTGQTGEVKRATAQDVRDRLKWLKRKKDEEKKDDVIDLDTRLENAKEREEREREEKRRKRNEKRRKTKDGLGRQTEKSEGIIR
jgi:U4/U6.U5 tri-snRNP component SNU23